MKEEVFEKEIEKALVRIAKLKAKGLNFFEIFEKLLKEKDLFASYTLGFYVGAVNALYNTEPARTTIHNLHVCVRELGKGVDEEEILRRLEKARKEREKVDMMTYGA